MVVHGIGLDWVIISTYLEVVVWDVSGTQRGKCRACRRSRCPTSPRRQITQRNDRYCNGRGHRPHGHFQGVPVPIWIWYRRLAHCRRRPKRKSSCSSRKRFPPRWKVGTTTSTSSGSQSSSGFGMLSDELMFNFFEHLVPHWILAHFENRPT